MPTAYYGIPGNVVYPAIVNISASTNASPIVVTTSSAHGLQTGDKADIQGHTVNTHANGIQTVTRTGANSFSINGSTGNGVGGATGTVQPINYGAGYNIPSDGTDARNAASVNVPFQALGDRSAADLVTLPVFKLVSSLSSLVVSAPFNQPWMQGTGPQTGLGPMTAVNGGTSVLTAWPGFNALDVAEVLLDTSVYISSASAGQLAGRVALALTYYPYGGSPGLVTTTAWNKTVSGPGSNTPNYFPLTLRSWLIAPSSLAVDGSTGFQLGVFHYFDTAGATEEIDYRGDAILTVKCWRPTGVPQ